MDFLTLVLIGTIINLGFWGRVTFEQMGYVYGDLQNQDIVSYKNVGNTIETIYLKVIKFFQCDLNVKVIAETALSNFLTYDGTFITSAPAGTKKLPVQERVIAESSNPTNSPWSRKSPFLL